MKTTGAAWEVDWSHPDNTGSDVWARNPRSHIPSSREWHWTKTGYLRMRGIATPRYRSDSWEVDWDQRNGNLVMARNVESKMPSAHEWHWVDFHTLVRNGLPWKPKSERNGRYINRQGYICLGPRAMSDEDIRLVDKHRLWAGRIKYPDAKRSWVPEHRLVALKRFGELPPGHVVRHLDGCKTNNDPANLVLGTPAENNADHETARELAMYWHSEWRLLQAEVVRLRAELGEPAND